MSGLHEKLETCVALGKALTETLDRQEVVNIIFERLCELIKATNWSLLLVDHDRRELGFEIVAGLDVGHLREVRITMGEGLAGAAALSGEPVFISDNAWDDPRFCRKVDKLTGFKTHSLICLPLKAREQVIGVLELVNPQDPTLFDEENRPLLTILADFMAIAIVNANNFRRLETISVTDDVSGFGNTRLLYQQLNRLVMSPDQFSIAFFDLDRFKQVVDRHGHLLGSAMLKEIAELSATRLDAGDHLVRYGGDEYVVIMPGQSKPHALAKIERIRQAMAEARFLSGKGLAVPMTASFGVATYPADGSDPLALLHAADKFLYRSKRLSNAVTG